MIRFLLLLVALCAAGFPASAATVWSDTPVTQRGADIVLSNTARTATGNVLTIGIAVDLDNKRLWARSGGGGWSNAGDPAANLNGNDITSVVSGSVFPAWSAFNGSATTINGGATQFERDVPSGFTMWSASLTWDSGNKDASIALSNGNLTATGTASSAWKSARGTVGHTTGKWYFELSAAIVDASNGWMGGVENASGTLTNFIGSTANGSGYQATRNWYINNVDGGVMLDDVPNFSTQAGMWRTVKSIGVSHHTGKWYVEFTVNVLDSGAGWMAGIGRTNLATYLTTYSGGNNFSVGFQAGADRGFWVNGATATNVLASALAQGDVLGQAIDLDNNKIWGRVNGGAWSDSGNPTTNTSGRAIGQANDDASGAVLTWSTFDKPSTFDQATLNPGSSAFSFAAPSGFLAWDPGASGIIPRSPMTHH